MRYSVIASVLVLVTLVLSMSGCSKQKPADVVDNHSKTYARGTMPKYSDSLRATQAEDVAFKYKSDMHTYGAEAEVVDVKTQDLPPPASSSASAKAATPVFTSKPAPSLNALPTVGGTQFSWPVNGKVISHFGRQSDGSTQEGMLIEARAGTPITASAAGTVAYVGAALAEYGQMVIFGSSHFSRILEVGARMLAGRARGQR